MKILKNFALRLIIGFVAIIVLGGGFFIYDTFLTPTKTFVYEKVQTNTTDVITFTVKKDKILKETSVFTVKNFKQNYTVDSINQYLASQKAKYNISGVTFEGKEDGANYVINTTYDFEHMDLNKALAIGLVTSDKSKIDYVSYEQTTKSIMAKGYTLKK